MLVHHWFWRDLKSPSAKVELAEQKLAHHVAPRERLMNQLTVALEPLGKKFIENTRYFHILLCPGIQGISAPQLQGTGFCI